MIGECVVAVSQWESLSGSVPMPGTDSVIWPPSACRLKDPSFRASEPARSTCGSGQKPVRAKARDPSQIYRRVAAPGPVPF